ncbi:MAG TPA: endo-1,4-beta-xylanase [Drouetiella sp.]
MGRDFQNTPEKAGQTSDKGAAVSPARPDLVPIDQSASNELTNRQRLAGISQDLVHQGVLGNVSISDDYGGASTEVALSARHDDAPSEVAIRAAHDGVANKVALENSQMGVLQTSSLHQQEQESKLRELGQTDNLLTGKFHAEDKNGPLVVSDRGGTSSISIPRPVRDGEQLAVSQPIDYKLNETTDAQRQWQIDHPNGPELGHIMHVQFKAKVADADSNSHDMTVQLVGSQKPYDQALSERVTLNKSGPKDSDGYQTFDFYGVAPGTVGSGGLNLKFNFNQVQNGGAVDISNVSVKEVNSAPGLDPDALVHQNLNSPFRSNFMIGAGANQLTPDNVAIPKELKQEAAQKFPNDQEKQAKMFRDYQTEHALDPQEQEKYLQRMKQMGVNTVTLPIYWNQIEKEPGKVDYAKVDEMIDLCKKYDMKVKLHPIVWADSYPAWADKTGVSAQQTIDKHIDDVIQHFGNKVDYVEVNELNSTDQLRHQTFDQSGNQSTTAVDNGLTRWVAHDGAASVINHVDETIRRDLEKYGAHAKLFENEYIVDQKTQDSDQLVARDPNHPDALGVQMHQFNGNFPALRIEQMLNERAGSNLPVYISEITAKTEDSRSVDESKLSPEAQTGLAREVAYRQSHDIPAMTEAQRNAQLRQAEQLVALYKLAASNKDVNGVSLWDFTDRNAWNGNTGGVLDSGLDPKISYYALQEYIASHSRRAESP